VGVVDDEVVVVMADFSPELLAARERLLDGIVSTWPIKASPAPLVRPTYPITIEAAAAAAERYRRQWQDALAEKDAVVASGTAGRVDGYWKREHRSRALYAGALLLLEAISENDD
jgi:hypothetical protein